MRLPPAGARGLVLSFRVGSRNPPDVGIGFELQVIAADDHRRRLSLWAARGRILGTVIGAFIVGALSNGLDLASVEPFWRYVAQGLVLIAAVVVDRRVNLGVLRIGRK